MDATKFPDVTTMTLEQAKEYLLEECRNPGTGHDLYLEGVVRSLAEAVEVRRKANEMLTGSRSRVIH